MGEEKIEEEKKEEEKKEEEDVEIVLKVDMHCEACARKTARALKGFDGVEEVTTDIKNSKVVVKGKAADPVNVWERLQKKTGRKVELISPLPKPPEENNTDENKQEPEEKKDEPPVVVTVVLNIQMHCEACAQVLQKRIRKIQGVESVETDVGNCQVIVKGIVDPTKLVEDVYKKTRKQVSIVMEEQKEEEDKKEEEEKEDEKKEEETKLDESKQDNEDERVISDSIKRSEYWPSKYYTDYAYAPQMFSDENPNACFVM